MSQGASLKRTETKGSKGASRSTFSAAPVHNQQGNADPLDPSQLDLSIIGWGNIEAKFNELKGLLSAPASGLNANQARAQQKKRVSVAIVQLLDRAQQDCRRLLIEGNAKAAVEAGLKTLHLKEAYYGHGHLQLVPAYFHLARTNQYMDKFKAAEEFLSLAQWTILRNKDAVDASLKAELHQTFGLLYASDSKLDAALKQLTCATYYLCAMNGPEHILTSFGYFDLGNVFAAKSNMEHAMAFYDKVKDIWYTHLTTALRKALEPDHSANQYGESSVESNQADQLYNASSFGVENLQDAVKMLRGIAGLQTERYGRVHPSTARSEFVLGMFMLWNGDPVAAVAALLKALEISKRVFGPRHPSTTEIRSLMLNFGLEVPEDTTNVLDDEMQDERTAASASAAPQQIKQHAPETIPELQAQPDPEPAAAVNVEEQADEERSEASPAAAEGQNEDSSAANGNVEANEDSAVAEDPVADDEANTTAEDNNIAPSENDAAGTSEASPDEGPAGEDGAAVEPPVAEETHEEEETNEATQPDVDASAENVESVPEATE